MMSAETPQVNDQYKYINTPSPEEMQIQLEQLVQQGSLSPEQARAILVDRSKMEDVEGDPQAQAAQQAALAQLQDVTESGGLTDTDRSKLNQISMDEGTQQRGARDAILQNAQARGMGGSGMELLAQMQNQQDSATRQNARDLDVAGMAQERALQALMNQGQLATQVGAQRFDQNAAKANAADAISQFNAQNQQQVGMANTATNNAAQAANLGAKQSISDQNTALRNQQETYNRQLKQQEYENKLKKAGGSVGLGQYNSEAAGKTNQSESDAYNKSVGAGMSAISMLSDERSKEDIEPFDASEFLDTLTPSKFRYKDKSHGDGDQVGVMAQDLEKSDEGSRLVQDSPDGKRVDYGKAAPTMMAALASLHERIKKLEKGES